MAVKMTHLTPRDAEDSYKTVLDYKGDNGSQIPGQNTAGDEEREKLCLRTLGYYPLLIQGPSPKVKRERFQKVFLKEKISAFSGSVKNPKKYPKYLAQMVVTLKTFRSNNRSRRLRVKRRSSPNSNPEIAESSPTL